MMHRTKWQMNRNTEIYLFFFCYIQKWCAFHREITTLLFRFYEKESLIFCATRCGFCVEVVHLRFMAFNKRKINYGYLKDLYAFCSFFLFFFKSIEATFNSSSWPYTLRFSSTWNIQGFHLLLLPTLIFIFSILFKF